MTELLQQQSTESQTVEAWHFLTQDGCLQYGPDTATKVEVGQVLTATERPIELCSYGLHASLKILDALQYAPGPILCRVKLSGELLYGADKLCATHREVLWIADITNLLHEFACWVGEQALLREQEVGRATDPRSWAAIEAKRAWLRGEITDSQLDAARDAAWDAAWDATWAAARDAARDAAWAAVREKYNTELENRISALMGTSYPAGDGQPQSRGTP